ncbi:unnamed protein product, partial [Symbiodinium pilosum]
VPEARKDGCELLRVAFANDGSSTEVRSKIAELAVTEWSAVDLVEEDISDTAERRLPEFTTATQAEKFKEQEKSVSSLREWIYAKKELKSSWKTSSLLDPAGLLPDKLWPILGASGHSSPPAFRADHYADQCFVLACGSSALFARCFLDLSGTQVCIMLMELARVTSAQEGGRKDDLAVALVDLPRTAQALKQPVPFIDKPASLFVPDLRSNFLRLLTGVMDAVHGSGGDWKAEKLRSDPLEDHDSRLHADFALLESTARFSGCGLAVVLLLGRRLVVAWLLQPCSCFGL